MVLQIYLGHETFSTLPTEESANRNTLVLLHVLHGDERLEADLALERSGRINAVATLIEVHRIAVELQLDLIIKLLLAATASQFLGYINRWLLH